MDTILSPIHPGEILLEDFIKPLMRLARYFGTSAAVCLRLQVRYDLEVAQTELGERIQREVKVYQQSATA